LVLSDHTYFVYMLTNCSRRPIYTGVCESLQQRHQEHREQVHSSSYTAQYRLFRLVYFERFQYIGNAINREKQIKRWSRVKKIALIESDNPKWDDLSRDWGMPINFEEIVRRAITYQNQGPSTPLRSARDDNSLLVRKKKTLSGKT
jgi:putative endonuclease